MSTPVKTTVSPGFTLADESGADVNLSIEGDTGVYGGEAAVHLLQFPNVAATLVATVGRIEYGPSKELTYPGGVVTFSGSAEAGMAKMPSSAPAFELLFAFNADGAGGLGDGVGFSYDGRGKVRATKPVYAALRYGEHTVTARSFRYYPALDVTPGGGVKTTFGTIIAYYQKSIITYDVQPFNFDDGDSDFEMYRIVSPAITTRDGEFEKPPTFPSSGAYPDKPLVLDTATFIETERVHEIGRMDAKGRAYVATYHVPFLEPYIGDPAYKPTKTLKESALPAEKFSKDLVIRAKNVVALRGQGKL